jgi:1-acyl-sn-glycerol-3-phosphate acyltransferase
LNADKAHTYARERGVSRTLYAFMRFLASVALRGWFRVRISGRERIPGEGKVIVAPNHQNFLDPFFVGIATRRHVRYMAKAELFRAPLGWLLLRLGAFPVRRGEADGAALNTAGAILADGGVVVVFPEGTRVQEPDALGAPHHGAGRLAVETGAPIIPAAIDGTSHLWRGALPKFKRVQLAFLPPVVPGSSTDRNGPSVLIDEQVWPAVREGYGRLRASPGLVAVIAAGLGVGGGLIARRHHTLSKRPDLLGRVRPRRLRRRH